MIRVLLAEDQATVRDALATLLGLQPDLEIVAAVGRGDEVVGAALVAQPDVALLDIEMPGMDGLEAAAQLHERLPACKTLILTTFGRGTCAAPWPAAPWGFWSRKPPRRSWRWRSAVPWPGSASSTRRWPWLR